MKKDLSIKNWILGSWISNKPFCQLLFLANMLLIPFMTSAQDKVFPAVISKDYDALWNDPAIEQRISEGIKKNRMGTATLQFVDSKGKKLTNVEVRLEQTRHDFLFGANLFMLDGFPTPEENRQYEKSFLSLFNYATIPFYWSDLEPEQGKPRYEKNSIPIYRRPPPDALVEFCQKNNIAMKGHPLVWHQWYPKWRPENPEEAMKLAEQRIKAIAERYKGSIKRWEVVNEPVERPFWAVKWFNLPDDYLVRSFVAAAKEFPKKNVMMINEATTYSWLKFNGDSSLYYKMIRGLLDKGIRIDEIGMQLHVFNADVWKTVLDGKIHAPKDLFNVLDKYYEFGRPIAITELTIPTLPNTTEGEKTQSTVVRNWYRLWFSHPAVNGITWWNIVDATAAPGEDKTNAGMFRRDFSEKLSANALHDLIKKDWWTIINQNSGKNSDMKVQGFYGDYQVTAKCNGKTITQNIHLEKNKKNIFTLKF